MSTETRQGKSGRPTPPPRGPSPGSWRAALVRTTADSVLLAFTPTSSATLVSSVPIVGTIDSLTVFDIADPWSGGEMVVAGERITIPRSPLVYLPADRFALTDFMLDRRLPDASQNDGRNS